MHQILNEDVGMQPAQTERKTDIWRVETPIVRRQCGTYRRFVSACRVSVSCASIRATALCGVIICLQYDVMEWPTDEYDYDMSGSAERRA